MKTSMLKDLMDGVKLSSPTCEHTFIVWVDGELHNQDGEVVSVDFKAHTWKQFVGE